MKAIREVYENYAKHSLFGVKFDLFFLVLFAALVGLLISQRRKIYLTWKYPKVKSFFHVPIIGHLGFLTYINPSMNDFMDLSTLLSKESGKLIYAFGLTTMMLSKVEHLEVVLTHPHTQQKHYIYDFFENFVGNSIFRIGGKQWKKNRKAMAPTMHHEAVAPHTEDMCERIDLLVEKWRGKTGKTFNAQPDIAKCIMEMFAKATFGVDLNVQETGTRADHFTDVFLEYAMYRVMAVFKHPDFIYKWTKDYKIQQEALTFGHKFTDKIFYDRKAIYDREKEEVSVTEKQSARKRKFLDHLFDLSNETNFSTKQVKDELNTFFIAGFDTCSSGVSFTLISLAMHQDIQEKVYNEIIDVIGPDRAPEYSDLSKMVYLEQVIKEALRIFPPAPIIARNAEEEFDLCGNIVPKDTQIGIYLLETHRSELYWKDPLKFDPERFSPENMAKHHKYSYMPFLAGPRICFGTNIAWVTLKCTVLTLIRKFKMFTPYTKVEDINLCIKMTLKAKDGMLLRLEER